MLVQTSSTGSQCEAEGAVTFASDFYCFLAILIDHLVHDAVKAACERDAADEWADWKPCFGPGAPADREEQIRLVLKIASARAFRLLAFNEAPPSPEGRE
jgi:hypothetical protein